MLKGIKTRIAAAICILACFAGCFEDVSYDTSYVLKPLLQTASGSDVAPLEGTTAYAFAADTADWEVVSYEDALAGIITSRHNPAEKNNTPIATTEPYQAEGATGWLSMRIRRSSALVVAVDPTHRIYGYRQQGFGENMPRLYSTVVFRPWKEDYDESKSWFMRNDFYTPPLEAQYVIEPYVETTEGTTPELLSSLKAYAYAVDTTDWKVASYDDATLGIITSKYDEEETKRNPMATAARDSETGFYTMTVTSERIMLIVADTRNRRYAYSRQDIDLTGGPYSSKVTFRPWRTDSVYVEEGWRFVNNYDPDADKEETLKNRKR